MTHGARAHWSRMFKIAYFTFFPALLAVPAELIAGAPTNGLVAGALWLVCLGSLTAGVLRRP